MVKTLVKLDTREYYSLRSRRRKGEGGSPISPLSVSLLELTTNATPRYQGRQAAGNIRVAFPVPAPPRTHSTLCPCAAP